MRRLIGMLSVGCVLTGILTVAAWGQESKGPAVPRLIRFSGVVRQGGEKPVRGVVELSLSLFKEESGGEPLWFETQTVEIDAQGRYNVLLGAMHADGLPMDLFTSGEARWLSVMVDKVEQPRVLLVSVPYALKAGDAATLGGKPVSAFMQVSAEGGPGKGVTKVVVGDTRLRAGTLQRTPGGTATPQLTSGTTGYIAKFTSATDLGNSALYQSGNMVGVGTTSPAAPLDVFPAYQTGTSSPLYGARVIATYNPSADNTSALYGMYVQDDLVGGNPRNAERLYAMTFLANHKGSGTVTTAIGTFGSAQNFGSGTVSHARGLHSTVNNLSTGAITNGYGLSVGTPLNIGGGTFSNYYGVHIADATSPTNSFGLYSLPAKNYFRGSVGIGVVNPSAKLDVAGDIKSNGNVTGASASFAGAVGGGAFTGTSFTGSGAGLTSVNADTLDSMDSTAFAPAISSGSYVDVLGDVMVGQLVLPANGLAAGGSQLVLSSGRVGVGILNPNAQLHVDGTDAADGGTNGASAINGFTAVAGDGGDGTDTAGNGGDINLTSGRGGAATGGNNGGIEAILSVGGGVGGTSGGGGAGGSITLAPGAGGSPGGTAGNVILASASGKVGIGTVSPLDLLHVAGDIRVGTGSTGCVKDADGTEIAGSCASDLRFKTKVLAYPSVLAKLVQLNPVTFNWKSEEFPERHFGTGRSFGLIAQEVEKVLPDMVTEDSEGFKAVKYHKLPFLMLQGIRELKSENDTLKDQVSRQQTEIGKLTEQLATIAARLAELEK